MKMNELHNQPVEADTYESSMALNQLLKIGRHAIKIHNMIDDSAEMEAWVAKKIDLAGDYVKKVHGYMQGEKAGLYDDGGLTEDAGQQALANDIGLFFVKKAKEMLQSMERPNKNDQEYEEYVDIARAFKKGIQAGLDEVNMSDFEFSNNPFGDFGRGIDDGPDEELVKILAKHGYQPGPDGANDKATIVKQRDESVSEDAGEGHMSKSTLYHTAKYAIELMSMIRKGDDLEGWVQSKLNKAADYLQGVHNYEEYQKLNPYREELDANILQRHAGIVQKHIDEILAKETKLDDVDTKPGMMRILAKRVNEVEKEIAKEQRKGTDEEAPPGREKQVKALKKKFKDKGAPYAIAWAQHNKHGKPKKEDVDYRSDDILIKAGFDPAMVKKYIAVLNDHGDTSDIDQMNMDKIGLADAMSMALASHGIKNESVELEEGIKEWGKRLAMAGVIVAGLAGVNSVQDAIDRSVPAVAAMEKALEMAQDQGNDELAKMIKGDLSAVKVRLSSGKDLNFVKGMQDKYSKFIQTEGLAYESRLAVRLEQRIK
jgi:hypothetical protein